MTWTELVVVLFVIFILIALLLPVLVTPVWSSRTLCRSNLRRYDRGLRMYLSENNECLPLAWHVAGQEVADDYSNLTYYRFLIHGYCDARFQRILGGEEHVCVWDRRPATIQDDYEEDARFWMDDAVGWTKDYMAPDLLFRVPKDPSCPPGESTRYPDLLKGDVRPADRPVFTEVNASRPMALAEDRDDPIHQQELRDGFSFVRSHGIDVFIGVGPSLRQSDDYATSRFDFRHNGVANFLFLDGHVDSVKRIDAKRLTRIHDRWNHLVPEGQGK